MKMETMFLLSMATHVCVCECKSCDKHEKAGDYSFDNNISNHPIGNWNVSNVTTCILCFMMRKTLIKNK